MTRVRLLFVFALLNVPIGTSAQTALTAVSRPVPNRIDNVDRPLRYRPDGQDFVIDNGGEFFNRPLYGGNTAFRVDAGDQPEFSLYLPGHGGNLRFGIKTPRAAKWLHESARITSRYRPGTMLYEIRDPLLGAGAVLHLHAVALHQTDALVVQIHAVGLTEPLELVAAYGGLSGRRGVRDGDIGTESVPISEYFQLKPSSCEGNVFVLGTPPNDIGFILQAAPATVAGLLPANAQVALADATHWKSLDALLDSASPDGGSGATPAPPPHLPGVTPDATQPARLPVVTARITIDPTSQLRPVYVALQRAPTSTVPAATEELATYRDITAGRLGVQSGHGTVPLAPVFRTDEIPRVFDEAVEHFRALRTQVVVRTPDPFLDSAVAALQVGADAVWDEAQGVVMHGAVAWRSKLLGWRGPYALDALGRHDRARRHLAYWATRQNTDPIPDRLPPPDERFNLSRSEVALHSNGDMSNSHYDMNAVYIDALFRHLLWTGDLELGARLWPVIERHLAWERRLFRREYGPERLPLYEAYAAIWASDDLQYHGGGTTHASAYNHYHNAQAARLARLLGKDPSPYEREATLIARAMREHLWMPDRGMFAEFKDYLGLQRLHPSAGLWSFYHTMDANLPTPAEARQMADYVAERLPHIPVRGPGVPTDDSYHVLSTTDWMPYSWSINNVVLGENLHTALGLWQAGRAEEAFRITKGALLASMFMGICPGNVGTLSYLDVYRREAQRDFADGAGVASRAVVEGLFGLRPDVLSGELLIAPGFPAGWNRASLHHPDASVAFDRSGRSDTYLIEQRFPRPLLIRLVLFGRGEEPRVTIDGRAIEPRSLPSAGAGFHIEIRGTAARTQKVEVHWGSDRSPSTTPVRFAQPAAPRLLPNSPPHDWQKEIAGTPEPVDLSAHFNDPVSQIFRNEYRSPRSPFASLAIPKQGIGAWAGHVNATADIDDSGLRSVARANHDRITLPNGLPLMTPGTPGAPNAIFTSLWNNYPAFATVPVSGRARHLYVLAAGSTNWMQSRMDNGEIVVTYDDGSTDRLGLRNPETWWPIDQDYLVDDFQFRIDAPLPPRVDLATGAIRLLDRRTLEGGVIAGGAATVLELPLQPGKSLSSLTVRTLSNEVVIGLMAATLVR